MSDSTSLLPQLTTAQAGKEQTVNSIFDIVSKVSFGGKKQSSSGLSWDYCGDRIIIDGVSTSIASGTITLTASATNYVEATRAGVVSKNVLFFTPGAIALYKVVTGASTVTSYEDHRPFTKLATGILARSIATDANITLTHAEALCDILEFTSGVSLTATRNVVLPLAAKHYTVFNNTTGAQSLQFIGASGTGITVANGKRAIVYANGTNIVRVTADNPVLL